jgi:hypothetical protein
VGGHKDHFSDGVGDAHRLRQVKKREF